MDIEKKNIRLGKRERTASEKPSIIKRAIRSDGFVLLVWILGMAAVWEIGAFYIARVSPRHPEYILPHLWQIASSFGQSAGADQTIFGLVMTNAATLSRAGEGFLIGMALGAILALLMSLSGAVGKIAFPYLMIIQMIPILGMAPIVLSLTGDIGKSRIVIAAILTFYPVAANMLAGFRSVDREKQELMYSYAANTFTIYTKVMLPTCLPYFFTGAENGGSDGDNGVDTGRHASGRRRARMSPVPVAEAQHVDIRVLGDSVHKRGARNTRDEAHGTHGIPAELTDESRKERQVIPVKIKKSSRKWEKEAPSTFNTLTSVIYPVLFGAVIFVLWQTQILHRMVHTEEWILPTPSHIGQIIGENLTKLAGNLLMTLIPVIAGLALGSLLAVMCVAEMSYNAYRGLTEVQPFGEDLMATYAADRRTVFLKLRLPNSLPFIFTAMKVNLPVSVISALVS